MREVCTWEAACLFQQGEAGCGHTFTHFIALLRATIHSRVGGSPKGREDTVGDLSTTGGEGNQNLIPTLLQYQPRKKGRADKISPLCPHTCQ